MPVRKHKIDMKARSKPITKEELDFNIWYYSNMDRLGLYTDLDDTTKEKISV